MRVPAKTDYEERNWNEALSKALCAVLVVALTLAVPALARRQSQATTAEINGRVVDAQGGVLPGVTVTARNPETGYIRDGGDQREGVFAAAAAAAGHLRRDDGAGRL